MNIKDSLAYKLRKYTEKDILPFHMPGHKRKMPKEISDLFDDVYQIDLTELNATDALHYPEGIIKDGMGYISKVYDSDKSYYLVNGSTCGILAAIRALYNNDGKKILIDRNSHISAFHALELCNIECEYINYKDDDKLGISLGIDVLDLRKKLEENDIFGVYITSPTYEGIISDIEAISGITHEFKIPLIVDEAHGAHLIFLSKYISEFKDNSAIKKGADIVVQSTHKTLPALTQTAILHLKSRLVDIEKLEHNLRIFETSSPSYIFMSSIDLAVRYMNEEAESIVNKYYDNLKYFRKAVKKMKYIHIWEPENEISFDIGKIVLFLSLNDGKILNGKLFQAILMDKYSIEIEMSKPKYILAMTGICDTKEDFDRFLEALNEIDKKIYSLDIEAIEDNKNTDEKIKALKELLGLKSNRNIYVYPPGIPIVFKDEIIIKEHIDLIEEYIKRGYNIQGL